MPQPATGSAVRFRGVISAGDAANLIATAAASVTLAVTRSASQQREPPMTSTSESSPEPPLAGSSVLLRQEALEPGASPEPPLPASTMSLPEAAVAGASLEPPLLASSERQEVQLARASLEPVRAPPPPASSAKQRPRVSPAMPRRRISA